MSSIIFDVPDESRPNKSLDSDWDNEYSVSGGEESVIVVLQHTHEDETWR